MPQDHIAVHAADLAALLNVLNLALPEAPQLVREGELGLCTVWTANQAFDDLADALTAHHGTDRWLEEPAR